jgi:hypothetical protein
MPVSIGFSDWSGDAWTAAHGPAESAAFQAESGHNQPVTDAAQLGREAVS